MEVDVNAGALTGMVSKAQGTYADLRSWIGPHEWGSVVGPTTFFVVAVALLTYDHTTSSSLSEPIYWSALALILTVFTWLLMRVGRASRAIATQHLASLRDQPTGLGSSTALQADLAAALKAGVTTVLFVIELEALGSSEERSEQPSREQRLVRAAAELANAGTALSATVYRTEGTHFAMLAPAGESDPADLTARARATLVPAQQSTLANAHFGEVVLPREAKQPEHALQMAAENLAASKRQGLRSARRQAHAALLAALGARRPQLREHLRSVVPRVISVGRRIELDRQALDDVVLAAGLQDIGMLTLPESILEQAGPLSTEQQALLHAHPLAGERIVASASSLSSVARLVRSAYERYDGSGYPDGLVGEEIPLGARIIAPCVAAAAMTSNRPHRRALSSEQAVTELLAGAGTQFDPRVVAILAEELAEEAGRRSGDRLPG
jgi:HD-GYP domain-containing protein (c-di-GMP phosphodiesterase class II)